MAEAHQRLPVNLDIRHPHFTRDMRTWACQMTCEIHESVMATRETIAASKALMAQAERILARK